RSRSGALRGNTYASSRAPFPPPPPDRLSAATATTMRHAAVCAMLDLGMAPALTFDVFGTVVDWRSSIAAEARRLLGDRYPDADWDRFADGWRSRYQPSLERVRSGALPWTPLDDLHAASLDDLLRELGLTAPQPDRRELVLAWHRLSPWPDAVPGLRRLARRFTLATLSNGGVALLRDLVGHAGLPFHQVLSAEDARAYKPQPQVYLTAVRRLGLTPGEVTMV